MTRKPPSVKVSGTTFRRDILLIEQNAEARFRHRAIRHDGFEGCGTNDEAAWAHERTRRGHLRRSCCSAIPFRVGNQESAKGTQGPRDQFALCRN
jgi:hypothetical protein